MEKYIIGVQAKIAIIILLNRKMNLLLFLGDICCKGNITAANPVNM